MNEKSLLSLREIARELNTKYRTLVDYKNQFGEYIMTINEGRQPKYRSEYLDLFQLILALKDEGYDTNSIKLMLSGKHSNPPELDGWLEEWVDRFKGGWMDVRMDGCADGCADGRMDGKGTESQLNTALPTGILPTTAPRQSHTDLHETIQNQINQSISRLESRLISQISGIIPQINSALTQYYKVAVELQARTAKLESDLGIEAQAGETELDLEKIQVKLEHVDFDDAGEAGDVGAKRKRIRTFKDPKEYSDSPDLDLVKKSIHEGKPEKGAITLWIQAMQAKHPELSFSDMARILDHAGVPTMSGRTGWNRGTLRSFIQDNG